MTAEVRSVWLLRLCLFLGGLHGLVLLVVAVARVTYAFDVEWMEGGELTHAVRLLQNKPIYAPPSAEFTAFFYPPLYPTVVARLAPWLGGVTYALGRGVSVASTVVTLGLVFAVVRREADTRFALLAVGLLAALDRVSGTFSTVARPDALAFALALGAATLARYGEQAHSAALAALLAVAAAYAKQTTVVLDVGVAAWLLLHDRRRGVVFGAVLVVMGGALAVAIERATSGWFFFYVVSGHQHHRFFWSNALFYFYRDLLFLSPLVLLVPVTWGAARGKKAWLALGVVVALGFAQRGLTLDYPPHMYFREIAYESPRALLLVPPLAIALLLLRAARRGTLVDDARAPAADPFWAWMFVAALVAGALGHATQWAYKNAFLPVTVFGAVFVTLAARDLWVRGSTAATCVAAAVALQLVALADSPLSRLPTAQDRARLEALHLRLARLPGDVLVIAHPLLAYEHTGSVHVHQMGLSDVASQGGVADFESSAARHAWSAVITDEGDGLGAPGAIQRHYRRAEAIDGPWMKTGVRLHPAALWLPLPPAPPW